jgi:hypothetical protein
MLRCFTLSLLIILSSCQQKPQEILPTPMPTPAFLLGVIPEPGERISYEEYKARFEPGELGLREVGPICVRYDASKLLEYDDEGLRKEDYLARSLLLINGEVWPNSQKPDLYRDALGLAVSRDGNLAKGNAVGPFYFCWDVELGPGMHTVEFITRKTSGEELSYTWSFLITSSLAPSSDR